MTRSEIMSLGYGGTCKKELEDENMVIYSYSSYNLNEEQFRNPGRIYDGTITTSPGCTSHKIAAISNASVHEVVSMHFLNPYLLIAGA